MQKVYTNSILCTDQRVLNMVRRLRVDSNRDIQRNLRHIHLADDSSPDLNDLLLSTEQEQLSELIRKSITSNNSQEYS